MVGGSSVVKDEKNRDNEPSRDENEEGVSNGEPDMDAYVEELKGEDDVDDANNEDLCPSDILRSPTPSNSNDEDISNRRDVTKRVKFNKGELRNLVLQVGHTFVDANLFRKAVKQANILKVKDLKLKRN
jgi:hypothetical protein